MWALDHIEAWASEELLLLNVVLEKTVESPLDSQELKPVHPIGNQPWIFTGGLTLKLKLQYFGHLMGRADSLEKDPDVGKVWRQEDKGTTEGRKRELAEWSNRISTMELILEQQSLNCRSCLYVHFPSNKYIRNTWVKHPVQDRYWSGWSFLTQAWSEWYLI